MALADWEERPLDEAYYETRTEYFRQGDVFRDVPLGYPWPADALTHAEGRRKFLSGPFEAGFGLLLTPTCSMVAQGAQGYAHPVRQLAPVLPLAHLVEGGAVKEATLGDLRRYDHLVNYAYLPAIEAVGLPESLALLYSTVTVHHDFLLEDLEEREDDDPEERREPTRRVAQLSKPAAVHLKYKLTALYAGELFSHADFDD